MTVRSLRLAVLICGTLATAMPSAASAQDMRVYTSVSDRSEETTSHVISHSLTLFHAGKVYDYMEELGEVVVYEPVSHRFVILGRNYSATEVPFTELVHFLDSAKKESLKTIDELAQKPDAASVRLAGLIQFQIQPEFAESFDKEKSRLDLTGQYLNYSVEAARVDPEHIVRQYLDYADWAARLNYVLHPNSTYPEARLKLNDALRRRELLPTSVDLELQLPTPVRLRAEHSFSWEFQQVDRQLISHWERMLSSDEVHWMTFHEYQQQLLAQKSQ